jgi:hypothetical protein
VTKLTQGARFTRYLEAYHGFAIKDLTKATVAGLMKGDTLTPEVRELLDIGHVAGQV